MIRLIEVNDVLFIIRGEVPRICSGRYRKLSGQSLIYISVHNQVNRHFGTPLCITKLYSFHFIQYIWTIIKIEEVSRGSRGVVHFQNFSQGWRFESRSRLKHFFNVFYVQMYEIVVCFCTYLSLDKLDNFNLKYCIRMCYSLDRRTMYYYSDFARDIFRNVVSFYRREKKLDCIFPGTFDVGF